MTRTICIRTPEVKPTRRSPRKPGSFGAGILPSRPAFKADCTASDEAWWAAERAAGEDRHYDAMEAEAIALARLDMGLCL